MKQKILVQTDNKERYSAQHNYGVETFQTKTEFLNYCSAVWDAVVNEPDVIPTIQLTNLNIKD